ncbi:MAG: hypothetical protein IPJ61_20785 [Tessaracoccus sp.]|uniref:hypothetical protein n=1 Tax=Tessaracoccus sp. TaxID=1971211 RepID=UPI001ED5A9A1|nr:hypothetical protein [Tessaracoccus sp.]MBK7823426.1 hypothetical protein [Tessaracoccus sp.]
MVSGAPTSVNEIQTGFYTSDEIAQAITAWLQAEYTAGRLLFSGAYSNRATPDGLRGVLSYVDATAGSALRSLSLFVPPGNLWRFLGWDTPNLFAQGSGVVGSERAATPPLRALISNIGGRLPISNERGNWIDQGSILPASLFDSSGTQEGIVKIGSLGHAVVSKQTGYLNVFLNVGLDRYLLSTGGEIAIEYDDDQDVTLQQVIVAEGDFKSLMLQILFSTGASGFNHATYDTLASDLGCALPYSLAGADFVSDVENVDGADATICIVIDKPTRFVDVFNVDFLLRWAYFTWGAGRIHMRAWGTPTAGAAVVDLVEADKAISVGQSGTDRQRSTSEERFEYIRNNITVRYGRNADGDLVSKISFTDRSSMSAHGARGVVLDAINTLGQSSIGDIVGVIARFSGALPMFSRPHKIVRMTIGPHMYEQLVPGTLVTITDSHIRNPETGLHGITGWPGIVVANHHGWGGPVPGIDGRPSIDDASGEVDVMIFDRITAAPYGYAAQVDDTAPNSGYDAGTVTLKTYDHQYSTASGALDASHFATDDVVRILEIDPPDPTAALTWTRTVASVASSEIVLTSTLSSPAWDTAKKYRIVPAEYGSVAASQRVTAFQADDGDGFIVDTRQPFGMISSGVGQSSTFTLSAATERCRRYSTHQVGDGVTFDAGAARDTARLVNNLVNYKTAPQNPTIYSDTRSDTPTGTWVLVEAFPQFVGIGPVFASVTIRLYVAPMYRSKTVGSVSVRVTLSRLMPQGATRHDVVHLDPYIQTTFTTTSTTFAIPTAVGLDCRHVTLGLGGFAGLGFVCVEVNSGDAEYLGLPTCYVGPQESP